MKKESKKSILKQITNYKKMFISLYESAKKDNNKEGLQFTTDVLKVYEKNNINGHIVWNNNK